MAWARRVFDNLEYFRAELARLSSTAIPTSQACRDLVNYVQSKQNDDPLVNPRKRFQIPKMHNSTRRSISSVISTLRTDSTEKEDWTYNPNLPNWANMIDDILLQIFSLLDPKSYANVSRTCQKFRKICYDDRMGSNRIQWLHYYENYNPELAKFRIDNIQNNGKNRWHLPAKTFRSGWLGKRFNFTEEERRKLDWQSQRNSSILKEMKTLNFLPNWVLMLGGSNTSHVVLGKNLR